MSAASLAQRPARGSGAGSPRAAAAALRADAQRAAAALPPLLAQAQHLAASVRLGEHGRRRAGAGAEFWQYRPAQPGDAARLIDWRRSARSDATFVREREWQAAQTVWLWADAGRSMRFSSTPRLPAKAARAALLALAAAVLLVRGGERVGLLAPFLRARAGTLQLHHLAEALSSPPDAAEYGPPPLAKLEAGGAPGACALLVSDFLAPPQALHDSLQRAAAHGVSGALVMVLDPQEELFPFDGRTLFESMGGALRHETRRARDLRAGYLARLAARKELLAGLARATGWQFTTHHTDQPAASALLWLCGALGHHGAGRSQGRG